MGAVREPERCRDVFGVLREVVVEDVGEFVTPGSVLEQRLVHVDGALFVRKYVSRAAGARDPRRYDLLDREVRAGTRLGQVFKRLYPRELARLAAYNLDVEEPFALLHAYHGEPAIGPASRFAEDERRRFEQELFRALVLTAAAGVVHGAVGMEAVRWQEGRLQLVDFEHALRVGDPRWDASSPDGAGRAGARADPRDDVWDAARLLRRVSLGPHADGPVLDRARDPERLRVLLDPVFDNPVELRPRAAEVLAALRGDPSLPPTTDPEAGLGPGRALFDQVSAAKGGPPSPPPARPPRRGRRGLRLFSLLAVAVLTATAPFGKGARR
ncbi:hypothetical protein JOF41_001202 [Saccharothrix coeruleofusca]|uniref:hypothetical protein n=1 Tax=Saccharothrix coeruleofusca TaxID=33919 RepID=UPI001AE2D1F4|nr:hypothetical protein [Saccharothrix coeruleofusca]MBP2335024.1 hypothetical protein [Saccharothrix coeruleofusca]